MKKILIFLLVVLILSGCVQIQTKKSVENEDKTIIGQFLHYGNKNEFKGYYKEYILDLEEQTGYRPWMIGFNLHSMTTGEFVDEPELLINGMEYEWKLGTQFYIGLILPNPVNGEGQYARNNDDPYPEDLVLVYTEGTDLNENFKQSLDRVADLIKELERRNIDVFVEPINEIGIGHYWYSRTSPEKLVGLYSYIHDYLEEEKGLKNIKWVLEFIGSLEEVPVNLMPIKDKVDIIGLSIYDSDPGDKYLELMNKLSYLDKPFAFSEFGPAIKRSPDKEIRENYQYNSWDNLILADALENHYPDLVFVLRWSSVWSIIHQNNAKEFMERLG